jgi:hypothetical protein
MRLLGIGDAAAQTESSLRSQLLEPCQSIACRTSQIAMSNFDRLDVQSRHVVDLVECESFGLLCPELTNPFERRQASKTLEPLREVVGVEEDIGMRAKTGDSLVVASILPPLHCGTKHPNRTCAWRIPKCRGLLELAKAALLVTGRPR